MSSQFALDLRLARKKAGYTQDDLAHLLDTHQTVVSQLEHGKRRPSDRGACPARPSGPRDRLRRRIILRGAGMAGDASYALYLPLNASPSTPS